MAVYMISCEFKDALTEKKEIDSFLGTLGERIAITNTSWLIKTSHSPDSITGQISTYSNKTNAFVIEVRKNFSNFTENIIHEWIEKNFE